MKNLLTAIFLFVLAVSSVCAAQETNSAWVGEWGAFQREPSTPQPVYAGERLLISDCSGEACHLEISVETEAHAHCVNTGPATLQIESATNATAVLGGGKCRISLVQSGSAVAPAIGVVRSTSGCADYCTSGASFERSYPLHARTKYSSDDIVACYTTTSRAQAAICSSPTLAAQEHAWQSFAEQVMELEGKQTAYASIKADQAAIKAACDSAADPAACVKSRFERATADLQQRKDLWNRQVTEPGDTGAAAAQITRIIGSYRHTAPNGDVQGDTYTTTDTLKIDRASATSIRYSLLLNFYNGHECSLDGTASFRSNGAFIDERKPEPETGLSGDTCYFEIVPGQHGVQFRDPNGACRNMSCGARGGYGGAGFTFAEKMRPARSHPQEGQPVP